MIFLSYLEFFHLNTCPYLVWILGYSDFKIEYKIILKLFANSQHYKYIILYIKKICTNLQCGLFYKPGQLRGKFSFFGKHLKILFFWLSKTANLKFFIKISVFTQFYRHVLSTAILLLHKKIMIKIRTDLGLIFDISTLPWNQI